MRLAAALLFGIALAPVSAFAQVVTASDCPNERDAVGTLFGSLAAVTAEADLDEPVAPARVAPLVRDELPFRVAGLSDEKLAIALRAYERASERGQVGNPLLTVIDYSKPSTEKRLWVIDPATGEVLFHELVAHGRGSGDNHATRFGNVDSSHRTSLGIFRTGETYQGKHGLSMRLDGKDPGVNDNARSRAIVIHAADYVSSEFARAHGRLGRSHGCPAVDKRISRKLIDTLKGGSIVASFGGDDAWVARSPLAKP